jgi:hypothetical protein
MDIRAHSARIVQNIVAQSQTKTNGCSWSVTVLTIKASAHLSIKYTLFFISTLALLHSLDGIERNDDKFTIG